MDTGDGSGEDVWAENTPSAWAPLHLFSSGHFCPLALTGQPLHAGHSTDLPVISAGTHLSGRSPLAYAKVLTTGLCFLLVLLYFGTFKSYA